MHETPVLRWYQDEACKAAWTSLCTSSGNPVIVLPTGAGKSLVIAELCRAAVQDYRGRVIVLAHRKELLEQNADKINRLLPWGISLGMYSAGLKSRKTDTDIVVAGIQSVFKRAAEFGERHMILCDECHLVPRDGEGMYRTFLDDLRAINPKLRMVGLTATPFRTGEGALCRQDGLFQRICYSAGIQKLIADGYLCPVTNRVGESSVDTSGLHIRGGEFVPGEVERLFDFGPQVENAAREIVAKSAGRHSVLVFCSGVSHAGHVAAAIAALSGERCGVVTGDTLPMERANLLEQFKRQQLRFLCNVDVLTTGFDAPNIDCIAILRATMSPGLFAQMCGRGLRIDASKQDCLILDFGENIQRHGPIDALDYGKDRQKSGLGDAPTKTCPNCGETVELSAKSCECGWIFPPPERTPKHGEQADTQSDVLAKPESWEVVGVDWMRHRKRKAEPGTPDTLRIDYLCQPMGRYRGADGGGNISEQVISEWVCLEHPGGYAYSKAVKWWRQHSVAPVPSGIDDAIRLWRCGAVAMPATIETIRDGKWYRITGRRLDELPTEWSEEPSEGETWETVDDEELAF
jgi:DNA repair protein RadD